MKKCRSCLSEKPISEFWKNGTAANGNQMWQTECKICMRSRNSNWCRENRTAAEVTDAVNLSRRRHPLKQMLRSAKSRAKKLGYPFNLTVDDILPIPTVCPVLGIPLAWTITTGHGVSPEMRPALGYVRGNVIIISYRANVLRKNATLEELKMMVAFYENRI